MCSPADGVAGVKRFVLDSIVEAGGRPCPPGIVGVGRGSADYAMYSPRRRSRGRSALQPRSRGREARGRAHRLLNETGIGPMGLGGDATCLRVHVEHADTHMTLNPVAVNYQCWAARRATAHIPPTVTSTSTGRRDGRSPPHLPDDRRGDPDAAGRRLGVRRRPHHRHPRPHAHPHLRQGRRAADGLARRAPSAHGARRSAR